MRYFNWLWRAAVFVVLLGFAVKNDQPVTLRYFFGYEWHMSLVLVLLMFFAIGVVMGVLVMWVKVMMQSREISHLKRELNIKIRSEDAKQA